MAASRRVIPAHALIGSLLFYLLKSGTCSIPRPKHCHTSLQQESLDLKVVSRSWAHSASRVDPAYMELVVASMCENLTWFAGYRGPLSVYFKNMSCMEDLSQITRARQQQGLIAFMAAHENVGREGHTYMRHIIDNYDSLAAWTAFTQGAGSHSAIQSVEKLSEFLASGGAPTRGIIPIGPRNDKGFILFRDADEGESDGMDTDTNVYVFDTRKFDMANRAREVYTSLFGGSPCDAPPMVFSAGAQFVISSDTIRAKPRSFYESVLKTLEECHPYGWDLERNWLHIFNASLAITKEMSVPSLCRGDLGHWKRPWQCKEYKRQTGVQTFV
eukprot:TRINITY_DN1926_c0_g2_i1.p1 TRINITY_DN1926_c0_g2~~TRINITY_DN1926_c0_g2_i1.p1  ORF type:complete len:350 (+),score=31.73 TRINITY_DN1926_c0_g2_i1:66-1052(+)